MGHSVSNPENYIKVDSLEDAMAYWQIFPKENIIEWDGYIDFLREKL